MIPFLESKRAFLDAGKMVTSVELRERTLELPTQRITTEDQRPFHIQCTISYAICKPLNAVYGVEDVSAALRQFCQEAVRNVISTVTSTAFQTERQAMNERIREQTTQVSNDWGILVHRVVIQHIEPA